MYQVAAEHLKKGLVFLERGATFDSHFWPGSTSIISETTRNGLKVGLHQMFVAVSDLRFSW
jgi:hypothetical protein